MIVITTPTGQIGSQVLENLISTGQALRVIVRDASDLSPEVRERVEIVEGSHSDATVVDEAFAGADAVFWLAPPDPRAPSVEAAFVGFTRPAAEAFKKHGVKRVVGITALGRGTPWAAHAGYVTGSLAMDDLIASTGVALPGADQPVVYGQHRPPGRGDQEPRHVLLADLRRAQATQRRHSRHRRRCVAPAARPELERRRRSPAARPRGSLLQRHGRDHLRGPRQGGPLPADQFEAYKARFVELGMSEAMAQGMTDMAAAKNQGIDNAVQRTPENSTPTSFRDWSEEVLKPAVLTQAGTA